MKNIFLFLFVLLSTSLFAQEVKKDKSETEENPKGIKIDNGNYVSGLRNPTPVQYAEKPLIIVDGEVFEGDISSLDPKTIEKIEVVKGVDGNKLRCTGTSSNGVILITTKQKKKRKRNKTANQ